MEDLIEGAPLSKERADTKELKVRDGQRAPDLLMILGDLGALGAWMWPFRFAFVTLMDTGSLSVKSRQRSRTLKSPNIGSNTTDCIRKATEIRSVIS